MGLDFASFVATLIRSIEAHEGSSNKKATRFHLLRSAFVDLNKLYFDHQLSTMRATAILRREAEQAAATIARQIGCFQNALGAAAAPGWERLARANGIPFINSSSRFAPPSSQKNANASASARMAAAPTPAPRFQEDTENPDRGHADAGGE
jgi:hypothetical protein